MERIVALRERCRVAVLLNSLQQPALVRRAGRRRDSRNLRTWRQFVLGAGGRAVHAATHGGARGRPQRQVASMKAAADALGYFVGQGGHGAAAAAAVEHYRQF